VIFEEGIFGGNFFVQKSFPRTPFKKLSLIASTFSFKLTYGAAEGKTASLPEIEPQPLPPMEAMAAND
jgi:hypothetical protein